jgi:hypothetical protein
MKSFSKQFAIWTLTTITACFFFTIGTRICFCQEQGVTNHVTEPFTISAPIMEIDLENNLLVVAEEKIYFLAITQNGIKKWKTIFMNADGQDISAQDLQLRARVIVEGEKSASGKIEAHKIILQAEKKEKTESKSNESTSGSSIRLNNGVWKN